jgi:hypothetical protein
VFGLLEKVEIPRGAYRDARAVLPCATRARSAGLLGQAVKRYGFAYMLTGSGRLSRRGEGVLAYEFGRSHRAGCGRCRRG